MNNETEGRYTHAWFPDEIIPDESEMIVTTTPIRTAEHDLITSTAKAAQPGETPEQAAVRGSMIIALISLMRCCLLLPKEAASAEWASLERQQDGSGRLRRPPSKHHAGWSPPVSLTAYVDKDIMRALDEMHRIRQVMDVHTADDRIFQMDAQQLSAQIREACSLAGLEG